ncbi:MAG TPA: collagenase, partial [Cytophagales bacterium]|nr:collagenase [Cytophagales bacterium]
PVANFSASATSITQGGSVTFSDQSTNGPTSWSWSFPGGSPASSSAQNPTVSYSAAGSYAVTLTATNADGSDSETKNGYITVTAPTPPVADFTASATSITTGGSVSFTDQSTNSPTNWSWSFPGGSPANSSAQNPTVSYATAGTYAVTLTATNAGGNDSESKSSYITVTDPVTTYCASTGGGGYEYIAGVQVGSFSNSSGEASYSDFTNQTIS